MRTTDEKWMKLAIQEAAKGLGQVSPNPAVGCVIVYHNTLLAKGYHQENGGPHAEANAIASALKKYPASFLKRCTIYVSLEPCSTHGRTGACSSRILNAGFQRVVFGTLDPNPAHAGNCLPILKNAKIPLTFNVLQEECDALIRGFRKVQQLGLPWVAVKVGQSLDGRLDRPSGEDQWLTSPKSKQKVQELRLEFDAVLTSSQTAITDDPALNRRNAKNHPLPLEEQNQRFLFTRNPEKLPKNLQLFNDDFKSQTHVIDSNNLEHALREVAAKGCNSVMVEAGGSFISALVEANLVDEWISFLAPMISGGSTFTTQGQQLNETYFKLQHHEILEGDLFTRAIKSDECARSSR